MTQSCNILICGAGIAGIAAAYHLAVKQGIGNVVLVDERPPLSLTSDKSSEAYRNWWPGPDDSMLRFMNRTIDLLEELAEESDNRFLMNRRGYMYCTKNPATARNYATLGRQAEAQGAGTLRIQRGDSADPAYVPSTHTGYTDHPDGADLILDPRLIRQHFSYLAEDILAVLHTRRCGWLSGQQLGMFLLEEAKTHGVTLINGRVEAVTIERNRVTGVKVASADGSNQVFQTNVFVNAAGPMVKQVGQLIGIDLPIFSELHLKVAFEDRLGVVGRNAGLVILDDPLELGWGDDERTELAASDETRWLTQSFPPGIHLRPEGYHESQTVLMLWDYHSQRYDVPIFPLPDDPLYPEVVYPEVVMRGMTHLAPGLQKYVHKLPKCYVDGGYYTKTVENRPLIGPLPVEGAFICAAFSGFGLMAASAAGELLAAHITGSTLPSYANRFTLSRYHDPNYMQLLENWGSTGQL